MANYRTHISYGAATGFVAGALAKYVFPEANINVVVFGTLFGFFGGMIPDIDHDTGHALPTISALISTFLPLVTLGIYGTPRSGWAVWSLVLIYPCHLGLHWWFERLPPWNDKKLWKDNETWRDSSKAVAVAAICAIPGLFFFKELPAGLLSTYLLMFGIAAIIQLSLPVFKMITVHRGVFHTVPAIVIYAELVYLYLYQMPFQSRMAITLAAFAGALSHLILDEIYAVDFDGKKMRLKKSFGTALSFWKGDYIKTQIAVYVASVALLVACIFVRG